MRRIMLRVEDELHAAVFKAAHDDRKSINAWIADLIREKVNQ
ncbi:MAG: toxin-antitoxin system HicB family antitoxin [Naasia sp.]